MSQKQHLLSRKHAGNHVIICHLTKSMPTFFTNLLLLGQEGYLPWCFPNYYSTLKRQGGHKIFYRRIQLCWFLQVWHLRWTIFIHSFYERFLMIILFLQVWLKPLILFLKFRTIAIKEVIKMDYHIVYFEFNFFSLSKFNLSQNNDSTYFEFK